jgi:DNA-binding NtrC family response regulator
MSGIDLAKAVKARWPTLPVLLTSGYTAERIIPSDTSGEMHLLHKPYTIKELAEIVRQTIETGSV